MQSPSKGAIAPSSLYERLAAASGIKHFSLDCSPSEAAPLPGTDVYDYASDASDAPVRTPPCGGKSRVQVAVEGAAHYVLSSDAFDAGLLLDPRGNRFEGRIPGSMLSAPAAAPAAGAPAAAAAAATAVQSFHAWQRCVVTAGRWVRDPEPRRLPWLFSGVYEHGDAMHMREKKGLATRRADKVAREWAEYTSTHDAGTEEGVEKYAEMRARVEEQWTVRETLKYVWEEGGQCGGWDRFDAQGREASTSSSSVTPSRSSSPTRW